jgi:DNA-binding transcriptional LysR family regulator
MRYVLCASPKYLKKAGTPTSSAELLHHAFIAHSARVNPEQVMLSNDEVIHMKIALALNQSDAIITAAKLGLGLIWVPEIFVRQDLQSGDLVEVLATAKHRYHDIYVYYQAGAIIDTKILAFINFFCD